jgi:hypothetical protein
VRRRREGKWQQGKVIEEERGSGGLDCDYCQAARGRSQGTDFVGLACGQQSMQIAPGKFLRSPTKQHPGRQQF